MAKEKRRNWLDKVSRWTPDRYRTFLAERRRLIAERLNAFLNPAACRSPIA